MATTEEIARLIADCRSTVWGAIGELPVASRLTEPMRAAMIQLGDHLDALAAETKRNDDLLSGLLAEERQRLEYAEKTNHRIRVERSHNTKVSAEAIRALLDMLQSERARFDNELLLARADVQPVLESVDAYEAASARREHLGPYGHAIQSAAQAFWRKARKHADWPPTIAKPSEGECLGTCAYDHADAHPQFECCSNWRIQASPSRGE